MLFRSDFRAPIEVPVDRVPPSGMIAEEHVLVAKTRCRSKPLATSIHCGVRGRGCRRAILNPQGGIAQEVAAVRRQGSGVRHLAGLSFSS